MIWAAIYLVYGEVNFTLYLYLRMYINTYIPLQRVPLSSTALFTANDSNIIHGIVK